MATTSIVFGRSTYEDVDAGTSRRRRRVLVVDDDPSIRLLCAVNLRAAGFDVAEAADGRQGLEQATGEPPDLVLTDLRMPVLDGFALAAALRRHRSTRAIPVVFLSGETGVAERTRAYALGVAGFVAKPFDPIALAALLTGVIERSTARASGLATGPAGIR